MTRVEKDAEEMKRKNAGKVNKNASQSRERKILLGKEAENKERMKEIIDKDAKYEKRGLGTSQ